MTLRRCSPDLSKSTLTGTNIGTRSVFDPPKHAAQTITTTKKAKAMPRVFLSNACRLTNKMDELLGVLQHNKIDIAVVTESWLKPESEGISQLQEYNTFNKNRVDKDGGGLTVLVKNNIPCTALQIDTGDLEILWLAARPTWLPRNISVIILAAVYFPPKSPAHVRDHLIEHITTTTQLLQTKHDRPGFMILGDLNTFPHKEVTRPLSFKQVVNVPTRGKNTLDKIITNVHKFYEPPTSLPALGNSDHLSVLWEPNTHQRTTEPTITQYSRRYPDSKIREFGRWITQQDWHEVLEAESTDKKCDLFHDMIWNKIEEIFPLKKRRTHPNDKPWMNDKIKDLIGQRQKAHREGNK